MNSWNHDPGKGGKDAHLLPVKEKTPSLARKMAKLVLMAAYREQARQDAGAVGFRLLLNRS